MTHDATIRKRLHELHGADIEITTHQPINMLAGRVSRIIFSGEAKL